MAEQLIYLELGDDVATAVDRLRRAKNIEIMMIVPRRALLSQSVINLKILKSQANLLGKNVSLVTQDEVTKNFATQAGLKVFTGLGEGQSQTKTEASLSSLVINTDELDVTANTPVEPPPPKSRGIFPLSARRRSAPPILTISPLAPAVSRGGNGFSWAPTIRSLAATRKLLKLERHHRVALGLIAIGLLVLGSVAVFVLPKAYVSLEVQSELFQKQFTLALADTQDLQAAGQNMLTGRFIEVSRENVSSFPATGEENLGELAEGRITIVNYTGSIAGLLANTRFQSAAGLVFRIKNEILVPPARGGTPGRVAVDATADSGGTKYNVTAPLKLSIPGLGPAGTDLVYGEVAGNFAGGTDEITKIVSEGDINQAKEEAAKNIFVAAETELESQLKRHEELVPSLIQNDVIDAVPSVTPGAKQDTFEIRVQSRSWTILVSQEDLQTAIAAASAFELPEDKQVTAQTIDRAAVEVVESNFLNHRIDLMVKLDGRVGPRLDTQELIGQLANKSVDEGGQLLGGMTGVTSSSIEVWPAFLTRIPLLHNNIRVQIIYLGE
ncbi:MAG: hypothetical protein V1826_00740 [bacterium]